MIRVKTDVWLYVYNILKAMFVDFVHSIAIQFLFKEDIFKDFINVSRCYSHDFFY